MLDPKETTLTTVRVTKARVGMALLLTFIALLAALTLYKDSQTHGAACQLRDKMGLYLKSAAATSRSSADRSLRSEKASAKYVDDSSLLLRTFQRAPRQSAGIKQIEAWMADGITLETLRGTAQGENATAQDNLADFADLVLSELPC